MEVEVRRLRTLEEENARLKKLLAEAMLDNAVLKDLASKNTVTPGAKWEAVAHARAHHGLSERRACAVVGVSRRVIQYRSTRPDDAPLRQRLRALVGERRRFGYRRLGYLLSREGTRPNHKKLLRLYHEEGPRVRRRGGRKRALGMRAPMALPDEPNQRWSLDFVSDSLACGRRFRILCVVDDFTRSAWRCWRTRRCRVRGGAGAEGSTSSPTQHTYRPRRKTGNKASLTFMRDNWLSNHVFAAYDDIVVHCCEAWNKLIDQPWHFISIGMRD